MKYLTCLFLNLLVCVSLLSNNKNVEQYTASLADLDQCLTEKDTYEKQKIQRIDILKGELQRPSLPEAEQYSLLSRLYEEYKLYNYDYAYFYAEKMIELAEKMGDTKKLTESKILMAYCCLNAGLFKESNEIAGQININEIDTNYKVVLLSFYSKLNLDMAASVEVEPYRTRYTQESIRYSRQIVDILGEDNPESLPLLVNIYRCEKKYRKAIETIELQFSTTEMKERAIALNIGGLGQFHLLMGDTIKALPYLSYAAIADLKAVIKETPALCMLAEITYSQGDMKHASVYAEEAWNEANFFNARHRKIEVGKVLPIIEKSRFDTIKKQNRKLLIFAFLVTVLLILFLISSVIIYKQIKQLKSARKVNKIQNDELLQTNKKLKESDRIKNGYIGYFFSITSGYIDRIENFQKMLSRKIMSRQYDDLAKLLNNGEMQKEREKMFNNFDQIFLSIFPDFIEQFNALMKPEYQVNLKTTNTLTAELRIFALIRLGVKDSESIAKFLNYSVHTINTYKTKIKKRANIPSEQFEQIISEIEYIH